MSIILPISLGDGLDKLSILQIKLKFINNMDKTNEIKREIETIMPLLQDYVNKNNFHYKCLYESNLKIWILSDKIRDKQCSKENHTKYCVDIIEENDRRYRIKNKLNILFNSKLKEQKGYRKKRAVIYTHLGLGDMLTMNGAIRYISMNYDETVIFCKKDYYSIVKRFFEDDKTISFDLIEENPEENTYHKIHYFFSSIYKEKYYKKNNYDIYLTGTHVGIGKSAKQYKKLFKSAFYNSFYDHLNLPYNIRFDYFYINHDHDYEIKLFNETVENVGEYIFIHDDPDRNKKIDLDFLKDTEKCIFHPNINYYQDNISHKYYNVWKKMENNIINYSKIIENASEIYVLDSAFFCLANYLNLKARKRYVYYSAVYDIINYIHPNEKSKWTVKLRT